MTSNKSKDWAKVVAEPVKHKTPAVDEDLEESLPQEEPLLSYPGHAELEEKLTQAEQALEKANENLLRTQAEMQNIQRRSRLDVEEAHKYGIKKLALELLLVVDNLERALAEGSALSDEFASFHKGVELTYKMFLDTLAKFGIQVIDPLGQEFNPTFHEAVAAEEAAGTKTNTVVRVLQKGYQLHDRLLRPAMVVVAK
ncbi:MAG: nucleotide exchange factor GrpE [Gammaproteobacteria bacterium]